jgi:hypothetical protein
VNGSAGVAPSPLAAALAYAAGGWPVVPLHTPQADGRCSCRWGAACTHSGKHPRYHPYDLPDGLYAATRDLERIQRWWRRWPSANVGIATGAASGLLVVDLDSLADYPFPATAVVRTANGRHIYLRHPGYPIRNRIRLLPDLDIRADRALIVAPPSRHASGQHYCWQPFAEPADPPSWLLAHLRTPPRRSSRSPTAVGRPYAQAVLRGEMARLRSARPGTRNTTLNWVAYRCGQFVGRGDLDQSEVTRLLTETALGLGLPPREVAATVPSTVQLQERERIPARRPLATVAATSRGGRPSPSAVSVRRRVTSL